MTVHPFLLFALSIGVYLACDVDDEEFLGRVICAVAAGYVVSRAADHVGFVLCQEYDRRRDRFRLYPTSWQALARVAT
jgi:hypothetical protein